LIGSAKVIPISHALGQNYPNPFNPVTSIRYQLPEQCHVNLKIFDVLGREITTLVNEQKEAGEYNVIWNAEGIFSGVYFYRMTAGSFSETKKLLLLR
jgi:hypothetical protein